MSVYRIGPDWDHGSEIDFMSFFGDWEALLTTDDSRVDLTAIGPPSDFHACPGTLGLASERLWRLLEPWARSHVRGREAYVDGRRYFVLVRGTPLDVLDHSTTDFEADPEEPGGFLYVNSFGFRHEAIPKAPTVFWVPEGRAWLFCNEAAADALRRFDTIGVRVAPPP